MMNRGWIRGKEPHIDLWILREHKAVDAGIQNPPNA